MQERNIIAGTVASVLSPFIEVTGDAGKIKGYGMD